MAASAGATLKRAGIRGAGWAILAAGLTAGVSYLQLDDPRNCARKTGDARTECRAYNKAIDDDKDQILINVLLAAGAALAGRAGGEGLYDARRQRNNDVDDADVQDTSPGRGGRDAGGGGRDLRHVEVEVDGVWYEGRLRSWDQGDDGTWLAHVAWSLPDADNRQTNTFPEEKVRPLQEG